VGLIAAILPCTAGDSAWGGRPRCGSRGFAGGMRIAETCGAVTGAIMVLGLCRATAESTTAKRREPVYMAVQQFMTSTSGATAH